MNIAVNNIVFSLLAVSTILGGAPLFGEEAEFVPYTGQTNEGNYLISDANGLAMLAENIRNSAPGKSEALAVYSQSTFRLTADIDLAGRSVLPIGVAKEFVVEGPIRWPERILPARSTVAAIRLRIITQPFQCQPEANTIVGRRDPAASRLERFGREAPLLGASTRQRHGFGA